MRFIENFLVGTAARGGAGHQDGINRACHVVGPEKARKRGLCAVFSSAYLMGCRRIAHASGSF
jgi:hypothetical protein